MTNKKSTKRALMSSVVSLILCFSMLLGTTYAWFTDTVSSGTNIIAAGNLDIELYHNDDANAPADKGDKVSGETKLFDNVDPKLWEPGAMAWEKFTIANEGSLALKYQFALNALNATKIGEISFADVLKVAIVDETFGYTRAEVEALPETDWDSLESFAIPGELEEKASKTFGIVIWWQPSENDNIFNTTDVVSVEVGVVLTATQLANEEDGFGTDYDEDAEYPTVIEPSMSDSDLIAAFANGGNFVLSGDIEIPEGLEVPQGTSIRIDMAGHQIEVNNQKNAMAIKGDVTLTSSTGTSVFAVKSYADATETVDAIDIYPGGTLTIEEADIQVTGNGTGVGIMNEGTLNMYDGTITVNGTGEASYGIMNVGGEVNLYGGQIIVEDISGEAYGIQQTFYDSAVNLYGGKITVKGQNELNYGVYASQGELALCIANDSIFDGPGKSYGYDSVAKLIVFAPVEGFEGLYVDKNNAKSYYVFDKTGLMNLNGLLAAIAPNEGNINTLNLMADVDLTGEDWAPINSMWITFNGNNHTISNLTAGLSVDGRRSGFWGYAGAVTINDLTLENVTVNGSQAGIFVGGAEGTKINNCFIKGNNTVNFVAGVETWNGIGAVAGVTTSSNMNVEIVDGATVTLNRGEMVTDPGCTYVNDLTGHIQENSGTVTNNGTITVEGEYKYLYADEINASGIKDIQNNSIVTLVSGNQSLPSLAEKEGLTIIGVEGTVIGGENDATGFASNFGKDTTIKNIIFSGNTNGVRWSYAKGGNTTFDNCTFAGDSTYGFHIDQSNGATFTFNNCTFIGFNAFASDLEKVVFNNCTFLNNGNYGHTNIWSVGEFNNCTWGEGATYGPCGDGVIYIDGFAQKNATSQDELNSAINTSGNVEVVLGSGTYTLPASTEKTVTISGTADTVIDLSNGTAQMHNMTYVFDGVTIKGATENYKGIFHSANVTYRNCTLTGLQFLYADTVAFENCTFNSENEEHSIWTYGSKKISFVECDFTYNDRCINVYYDNGKGSVDVNFDGCTFTTENTTSKGAVEINSSTFPQGAKVSFVDCTAPAHGTMVGISGYDGTNGATANITVDGAAFTATQWAK